MKGVGSNSKAAIFRAIAHSRRSVKRFETNRWIPSTTLRDVLQSTMRSPSSFNLQPTQIVMVQDKELLKSLSSKVMMSAGNQYRVKDCSALAVFLTDLEATKRISRIQQLEKEWGHRHPNYLAMMPISVSFLLGENQAATWIKQRATDLLSSVQEKLPMPVVDNVQSWGYKNTALVAQSYVLAATSHDLATCLMEGFDARRCKRMLRIPDRYDIPMMVATGYDYYDKDDDDNKNALTPRLDIEEIVFSDSFGKPFVDNDEDEDDESPAAVF